MEKRNNKKLFAIIGGSVLAFVLTIALSVSITLAYFGASNTGFTTVKLSGSVEVGTVEFTSGNYPDALPGEPIAVTGSVDVTSDGDGTSVAKTPAFVRVKFVAQDIDNFLVESDGKVLTVDATVAPMTGAKWLVIGEYAYVVASTETKTDATAALMQVPAGTTINFSFKAQVNPNLNNDWAGESLKVDLVATAIQGELPVEGVMSSAPAISVAVDVFEQVETTTGQIGK